MNLCADILQNIENDPNFLGNVITCDESWFFQYGPETGPETKGKSIHWKNARLKKEARKSKSNFKVMMIIFFRYPRDCSH
jgi:hypothetical protein